MFKRLRNKFLLMHMGVVSLLMVIFFSSVWIISYNAMERNADIRLERMLPDNRPGMTIAFAPDYPEMLPPFSGSQRILFHQVPEAESSEIRIGVQFRAQPIILMAVDKQQHQVLSLVSPYEMEEAFYNHIASEAIDAGTVNGKMKVNMPGADNVTLKYRMSDDHIVFMDISNEQENIFGLFKMFWLIAIPLLAVIFLISLFFAHSSIRPIEASYNRQKEFIADASHELKTPLAAISANLDILTGSASPEQNKWLKHIKSEVKRMTKLTYSLLTLAKMEYEPENMLATTFNISELVSECLLPLDAVLYEKGMTLTADIEPDVPIKMDKEQCRQLIGILTDNALRYGDKYIEVQLKRFPGYTLLTVANDGEGIEDPMMDKIWERFYRCDHSRINTESYSSDKTETGLLNGGFGLGLPMAKNIVEQSGGKISCSRSENGYMVFHVRLF